MHITQIPIQCINNNNIKTDAIIFNNVISISKTNFMIMFVLFCSSFTPNRVFLILCY